MQSGESAKPRMVAGRLTRDEPINRRAQWLEIFAATRCMYRRRLRAGASRDAGAWRVGSGGEEKLDVRVRGIHRCLGLHLDTSTSSPLSPSSPPTSSRPQYIAISLLWHEKEADFGEKDGTCKTKGKRSIVGVFLLRAQGFKGQPAIGGESRDEV